jgi:hypothetical protein
MCLRWAAATLVAAALFAVSCYSPNLSDRGYACGDHGECPTHFHCESNHLCYQGDASIDKVVVCDSDASAPQVCLAPSASGQVCNPGCQTGCNGCGWCAVVDGATTCLTGTAGSKDVGATCDPSLKSDCGAGLYCQPECGSGRCYRFCDSTDKSICGAGSSCSVAAMRPGDAGGVLPFTLCSLVSSCNAVSQQGCDLPFACYPTGKTNPSTVCECAGSFPTQQTCYFTDECVRGANCIQFGMSSSGICLQTCTASGDCTSGVCQNPNPVYGYCM